MVLELIGLRAPHAHHDRWRHDEWKLQTQSFPTRYRTLVTDCIQSRFCQLTFWKLLIQQYGGLTVLLEKVRTRGTRSTCPKAQTRPKTRLSTVTGHSAVLRRVLEGRGPQARPQRVPRVAGLGILKANDP